MMSPRKQYQSLFRVMYIDMNGNIPKVKLISIWIETMKEGQVSMFLSFEKVLKRNEWIIQ